ncbi:50S ribosomal protein L21 [Myxococcota bacterium]|jgi:large subunit ribosomal protein L21|nr:50S ribosomal protein L21 [Myxococcota bacterium]
MYAVVVTGGKQYRVSQGDTITVDRLQADVGSTIELGDVLLIGGDELKVGAPTVAGAKVVAQVVGHELGEKREIFKYRRTRRYRRFRGFRPSLTTLSIQSISA